MIRVRSKGLEGLSSDQDTLLYMFVSYRAGDKLLSELLTDFFVFVNIWDQNFFHSNTIKEKEIPTRGWSQI